MYYTDAVIDLFSQAVLKINPTTRYHSEQRLWQRSPGAATVGERWSSRGAQDFGAQVGSKEAPA